MYITNVKRVNKHKARKQTTMEDNMENKKVKHRKNLYHLLKRSMAVTLGVSLAFCAASSLAMDTVQPAPDESQTLLGRHGIYLNNVNTWGIQKIVPIGGQEDA